MATTNPQSAILAGFLPAQREIVVHDIEWFGGNFSRGSFSRGLLLEFRDEFFLYAENDIRIDIPRVLLEQVRDERLISWRGNVEVNVRGPVVGNVCLSH